MLCLVSGPSHDSSFRVGTNDGTIWRGGSHIRDHPLCSRSNSTLDMVIWVHCALHDEVIQKAVSFRKKSSQSAKSRQQFSQGLKPKTSFKKQSDTSQSSRKGTASTTSFQTPSKHGKGKRFWKLLVPFLATVGRHIRVALVLLASPQGERLDSGISGGSGQDAGDCRDSRSGLTATYFLCRNWQEDGGQTSVCCHWVITVCHFHSFLDGDSHIGIEVSQKTGHGVLNRPQGHLLSDSLSPRLSTISWWSEVIYSTQ